MPIIQLTKVERKRFLILFTCLLGAVGAWLIMALNNKYVYAAKTVLIYKEQPQKRAFKALQPDLVDLQVEGTGWQLLFNRLRLNPQSIQVSLAKLNTRNFVVFTEQLPQINKQLATDQKIISVLPDTLYFDFSKRSTKRVPVKLVADLGFVKQHNISSKIQLIPAFINISGPQDELAKIIEWPTDTLKLQNLQKTTLARVAVKPNNLNNINSYPTSVGVKIPVDEFTEKTVEVTLKINKNHFYHDVKLYPKKVKVTFLVALSNYHQVDAGSIEAGIDVEEWKLFKHPKFSVSLSRFPNYCKLISVYPSSVNFIIEK